MCLFSHKIRKDPNIEKQEMEYKNIQKTIEKLEKLTDKKDKQIENVIQSILHKFRKLEETIYNKSFEEPEHEMTF